MTREEIQKLFENQARARARAESREEQLALVERDVAEENGAVSLTLPLPPSVNRYFKSRAMKGPNGKWIAQVYKSSEAKLYAKQVEALCSHLTPWPRAQMLRFTGLVVMERAGCDLDDRLKVLLDALQGFVYENDEQVAEFGNVRRIVDSKAPRVEISFLPIAVDRYGDAR